MIPRYRNGDTVPVIVVGGGPTGVVAATMLAQRGVETLVIDRFDDVYPLPRAVHLDDEIYRVLQSIGAADDFAEITMPTLGMRLLDAEHRTMAEFRRSAELGEHGYPPANMFDQPDLEQVLRKALSRQPAATLATGIEVVAVTQSASDGRVRVDLSDPQTGAESTLWARAVLGCDGANSLVRESIGSQFEDLKFEERWVVVDIRSQRQLPLWQGVHQLCDPRRAATFMQVGPARYRWEFRLGAHESADDLINSPTLAGLLRPWLGDVPFDSLEVLRRAEYTFKARIADRWSDRRVFILGDAAHLTPPFIGQGLCAGVRDAANLSWKLAAVLNGQAPESILASYELERSPHARALVRKAVTVGWVMTGGQDNAARVRRVALASLCRVPGFTTKALDAKPPRFPNGPYAHRRGRLDRIAGTLAPQPFVRHRGVDLRLDEVLGPKHAVLVAGQPAAELVRAAGGAEIPVIRVVAAGDPGSAVMNGVITVVDRDDALTKWFKASHTAAVLVRPDRVVQTREPARRTGPVGATLVPDVLRVGHYGSESRRAPASQSQ